MGVGTMLSPQKARIHMSTPSTRPRWGKRAEVGVRRASASALHGPRTANLQPSLDPVEASESSAEALAMRVPWYGRGRSHRQPFVSTGKNREVTVAKSAHISSISIARDSAVAQPAVACTRTWRRYNQPPHVRDDGMLDLHKVSRCFGRQAHMKSPHVCERGCSGRGSEVPTRHKLELRINDRYQDMATMGNAS